MSNLIGRSLSKAKQKAQSDRSDSPLTPLPSTSHPTPQGERHSTDNVHRQSKEIDEVGRQFLNYDIKYRTIMRGNVENGQRIDELTENISRVELKFDTLNEKLDRILSGGDDQHDIPPHQIKQEELIAEPPTLTFNQKHFMKDPMNLHRSIHSKVVALKRSGENFVAWERQINETLDFVFHTDDFTNTPSWDILHTEHLPSVTILLRSSVELSMRNMLTKVKGPKAIYNAICTTCKRGDRQYKLSVISRLRDFYHSEQQMSNAEFISQFQDFYLELQQKAISGEELFGLILQSVIKPPLDVDEHAFRNNLNHRLNTAATTPLLDQVCQEITQVEGELSTGTLSNPILINRMQAADRSQKGKRPEQSSRPTFGAKAVANALQFRGVQPTAKDMAENGNVCTYCLKKGHWASNCFKFESDLRNGKIKLADLATAAAPSGPSNTVPKYIQVRALDVSAPHDDTVLIDSGASACVSGDSPFFTFERRLTSPIPVRMASRNSTMALTGLGSLKIPTPSGTIRIRNVYHNPTIPYVILSLGMLTTYGLQPVFDKDCVMSLVHKHRVFRTTFSNFCWNLVTAPPPSCANPPPKLSTGPSPTPCNEVSVSSMSSQPSMEAIKWHERLGHANDKAVKKFLERFVSVEALRNWQPFFCEQCVQSKITGRRFLPPSSVPRQEILDLVVSDVMGPFDKDIHGFQFAVTLRDHASMYTLIAPIKLKSDVTNKLISWFEMIKTRLGRYPRFLRCDNGGEFTSKKFMDLLKARGITIAHSSPYHPEENGEAERVNRTINDMARVMLQNSKLPQMFWSYAQQVAAYIHNRVPHTRIFPSTPIELLFGQTPVPEYVYPFGARALVFKPTDKRENKFDTRADECFLVGYPPSEKGWVFYNEHLKTFIHSANAVFPDFQTLPVSPIPTTKHDITFLLNNLVLGKENTDEIALQQQQATDSLPMKSDVAVPNHLHHALASPHATEWRKAAELELNQLEKLEVWEVVEAHKGIKVIGARWVFALKRDSTGVIVRFKARYVARGFNQRPGEDCGDTYAPTASLNTLRLLVSLAIQHGFVMNSFDVSSAYLYSPIEEEVYVKPPTELRPEMKGKVLRLKKALYGTKQAGRCWWLHFKGILDKLAFTASEVESSLYVYRRGEISIFIWMHVDDGLVVSNSTSAMETLRAALQDHLEVKWKTTVDQIVGINIHEHSSKILLEQHLLASQVATDYQRRTIHQNTTLPDTQLVTSTEEPIDATAFRSVLGSLMYLACGTRPDISYAVNMLARYSSRPSIQHWEALDHLVGYIRKNPRRALTFQSGETAIKLYVDAGWGGEHERSTTGYLLQHCGNPITWGSKRQEVVAMSTCAAEYVALSIATQTLANIKIILDDVSPVKQYEILCDNQAAVLVATDNASRKKTKYLQRAFYFVNDFVRKYQVKLYWISNQFQLADIFTKRLGASKHTACLTDISLTNLSDT
ncbi:hypothetical protein MJO28_010093 [Puccinia striiformis f. sp. tritici]|uniref:Uncharacterized protein n=1 Tax=Puccinia striiformis f. sp. tritici TaxID=168172 RepID=A0ACC0E3M0_9BASI|nr:hypothetical protein MJO28_010093 [Puccinia striiformis f. sp. tritici]